MSKSLFVGNLPWEVTGETLAAEFGKHGAVISARIINDKQTGRSRGFGFVDVEDADAEKIVAAMNGFGWGGRSLTVNEARPKTEGGAGPRRERSYDRY